jgi:hypothetical protein
MGAGDTTHAIEGLCCDIGIAGTCIRLLALRFRCCLVAAHFE